MLKRSMLAAVLIASLPAPAPAQFGDEPPQASGKCNSQSGVQIGAREKILLACNHVTVMKSEQGAVLLLFLDDDEKGLGFQGNIRGDESFGAENAQLIELNRLYMGGRFYHVSSGTCVMHWTGMLRLGGKLTGADCDANAEAGDTKIKASAAL